MAILAFIVVLAFAAPSFLAIPKYSVEESNSFLVLAILIAIYAAIPTKDKILRRKRARISLVVAFLLTAIRLWSVTLFSSTLISAIAVSASAFLILSVHALLPRLFVRLWAEQINPTSERGKRLLGLSRVVLPGLLIMGASIGRSIARQYSDQALHIMASMSFLAAILFMHIAISDNLYKADLSTSVKSQGDLGSSRNKKTKRKSTRNGAR